MSSHHHVSEQTVRNLFISFMINLLLSCVEFVGGIVSGSVSLLGDALHNTSDALSILIAVLAFKIGRKKADETYTYGFKRAEVIGGFINLILLSVSACYLLAEGIQRLIFPQQINGILMISISVFALIIDAATAKLSHHHAHHNTNMRMVFLHNLADALGSFGVIISGLLVYFFQIYRLDGVIALMIASYMIFHAVHEFPSIVRILMNAAPEEMSPSQIKTALMSLEGVSDVHHIHLWSITEEDISVECHLVGDDLNLAHKAQKLLADEFHIQHSNIQVEKEKGECQCHL